ncbi:MAG TPA: hypothetical protein VKH63_11825 [Candidatus Acidoferrum sp.]|nr:hypothetical protein [Candidatus Acidoferrum sp.]
MKRDTKKLALALLVACVFFVSGAELIAQSPQSSGSDKPQSSASASSAPAAAKPTPSASASPSPASASPAQASATPAKTQTPPANAAGVVWINTDTGVYHKQGTRWYGKTKHGKYMLEADAIKAGYKPAK